VKRFCLALDLKNDPGLILQYEEHHKKVWPEIIDSIRDAGIESMQIYRYANRLFMIMETVDKFSFETKAASDNGNEKVRAWEDLMWKYQQALPGAPQGSKWVQMDKIFELNEF
jgi:L-rhamnose mutarotase